MEYSEFSEIYLRHLSDAAYEMFEKIIDNASRVGGAFRVGDIEFQIKKSLGTSLGVRMGNFLEEVTTRYIAEMGYENLDKHILGVDLNCDQIFYNPVSNDIFLIEQKVRDDHDSSKLRGQFENFYAKCERLSQYYPQNNIYAATWFIDDSLHSNKKFWEDNIASISLPNVSTALYYGHLLL